MNMVWHYTAWAHLPAIVKAGMLRPGNVAATHELPMLWFSANQQWEPTATKMMTVGGGVVQLTFKEQVIHFGCVRFGLAATDPRLLKWKDACAVAGTLRDERRTMERVGKRKGGNPEQWFATSTNISLSELHFQLWTDAWCDTTGPQDMAEVWIDVRGQTPSSSY